MQHSPRFGVILFVCCAFFAGNLPVWSEEPEPLRRGSWAIFPEKTEILGADGAVVREAEKGEVVRVRIVRDGWAEVGSSFAELAGGRVPAAALRVATEEESAAWQETIETRRDEVARLNEPLNPVPPEEQEAALEAAEPDYQPRPLRTASSSAPAPVKEVTVGWFSPGANTQVHSTTRTADGHIWISGSVKPPVTHPKARGWQSESWEPWLDADIPNAFLARISPDAQTLLDLVIFSPEELHEVAELRPAANGLDVWVVARNPGAMFELGAAGRGPSVLLEFAADLRSWKRVLPLSFRVNDFFVDGANRPVVLARGGNRHGGAFLTRHFSEGFFERKWSDAPDGPARRLILDFSSPFFAGGPFALWAQRSEKTPDFPTPLGPWGSPPNAGQPMKWTNVRSGRNPIRAADLKPELLTSDREGNILVSGTIPFHMGFPDFDPFLISLTPDGRVRWVNTFLSGLLSEPDQQTLDIKIDPSNGDIIASYWQHGNNVETFLLDPNGWITRFTGTRGNISITWIGRVEADSGKLKNSTYVFSRSPNPANPGWPDVNSATISEMQVNERGMIFAAFGTTIAFPVTDNAFLPLVEEYGVHPALAVIKPDLSGPVYSTYLSSGQGLARHIELLEGNTAFLVGTHSTDGTPLDVTGPLPEYLSKEAPEGETGVFMAIVPVPIDPEVGWSWRE